MKAKIFLSITIVSIGLFSFVAITINLGGGQTLYSLFTLNFGSSTEQENQKGNPSTNENSQKRDETETNLPSAKKADRKTEFIVKKGVKEKHKNKDISSY